MFPWLWRSPPVPVQMATQSTSRLPNSSAVSRTAKRWPCNTFSTLEKRIGVFMYPTSLGQIGGSTPKCTGKRFLQKLIACRETFCARFEHPSPRSLEVQRPITFLSGKPNETLQATPVFAILLVLDQVPGAPDFLRWTARHRAARTGTGYEPF